MTVETQSRSEARRRRPRIVVGMVLLCVAVAAVNWLVPGPAGSQGTKDVNVIKSIRVVPSTLDAGVKEVALEVYSSRAFPARALPPVLRIGAREFRRSRYSEDGSLHTLIFFVPSGDFRTAVTGDPVLVYYGTDSGDRWEFGKLNKALLK